MSAYVDCRDCDGMGERIVYTMPKSFDTCGTCGGMGSLPVCVSCREPIMGCIWNGGRCLDCHERALLPETAHDRWEAVHAL